MVGIQEIGIYIPKGSISNFEQKERYGVDDNFIKNKIGVEQVAIKSSAEETSDLCVQAYEQLSTKGNVQIEEIDCMIVCTQNPDGHGIPHTSAIVHGKLNGRDDCACFDVSLGCSGYVYSLSIIKSFMEANGFKKGLLFTADPYSKILNRDDKNTSLLFGDAATVTLLTDSGYKWIPRTFSFSTRGSDGMALHNNDGDLKMDGRAVFNFSVKAVPVQIQRMLEQIDVEIDDVDVVLLHQGSKYIVETIAKRLRIDEEAVPIGLTHTGNTVSSSIPLMLEKQLDRPIERIVMSGFGVGLSVGSCVIERAN